MAQNQATGGPESGHRWPGIRPPVAQNQATRPLVAQNQATGGPESGHWWPRIRPWSCMDVDVMLMVLLVFFCFGKPHGAQLQWLCATHRARFYSRACFRLGFLKRKLGILFVACLCLVAMALVLGLPCCSQFLQASCKCIGQEWHAPSAKMLHCLME